MHFLIFFNLILKFATILGGLVLTYPQARFPPIDYLPDDLTLPPCGVPKPAKPFYTTLHIGDAYNVTWLTASDDNLSTYQIRLIDSDGLTVDTFSELTTPSKWQQISLKSPCEQCVLLVEQKTSSDASSKMFRSCADVHVVSQPTSSDENCSQRGLLLNSTCQCETGFTGDQCQYYAHCNTDEDCMNGGSCVDQPDSLIRRRCFCSYGFFGQRCDRKFNTLNDNCFAYNELSTTDFPRFGMFNQRCFNRHDLSADDQIYSRRVDDEVEIILDFATTSWISIGWRPIELSTSCRLFPILEDTRGTRSPAFLDEETRRHVVAKPIMPKNNGFTNSGLKSPLHAMDCVDMVIGAVRDSRLFISDFYSRDRSSPLEDYWYDGEMSLTAAYGIEADGRTLIMFRRELREYEPTDHPLGPNKIFVFWSKGNSSSTSDGPFQYPSTHHGIDHLDVSQVVNVTFEESPSVFNNDVAVFGVKNLLEHRLEPMTMPSSTTTPSITTTSSPINSDDDNNSAFSPFSFTILLILFVIF